MDESKLMVEEEEGLRSDVRIRDGEKTQIAGDLAESDLAVEDHGDGWSCLLMRTFVTLVDSCCARLAELW